MKQLIPNTHLFKYTFSFNNFIIIVYPIKIHYLFFCKRAHDYSIFYISIIWVTFLAMFLQGAEGA